MISPLPNTPAILINDILIPILDAFWKFKAHLSVFSGEKNKLHVPLKRSSPTRRVCEGWEKKIIFSVSPQSHSLFPASFQTFCLTARAYLSRQKYGLVCSRVKSLPFIYVEPWKRYPFRVEPLRIGPERVFDWSYWVHPSPFHPVVAFFLWVPG